MAHAAPQPPPPPKPPHENADLLTLSDAANSLPHRPHTSCLWRWCRKGVIARNGERVRLRHLRIGGKIFTSRDWLADFGSRLASADAAHFERVAADEPQRPVVPSQQQRLEQIEAARRSLAEAGI
jgi:hypothetical protein